MQKCWHGGLSCLNLGEMRMLHTDSQPAGSPTSPFLGVLYGAWTIARRPGGKVEKSFRPTVKQSFAQCGPFEAPRTFALFVQRSLMIEATTWPVSTETDVRPASKNVSVQSEVVPLPVTVTVRRWPTA